MPLGGCVRSCQSSTLHGVQQCWVTGLDHIEQFRIPRSIFWVATLKIPQSDIHWCAGCTTNGSAPAQGDVRLVDLSGIIAQTSPCDAVHFGGVEIFNNGQWGRVCSGRFRGTESDFTIDATVICRQLGFPFGSLMDAEDTEDSSFSIDGVYYDDSNGPGELVWATDVVCTGTEARLDECFFPEDFGAAPIDSDSGPAVLTGVSGAPCGRRDGRVLGVACRQFEIEGARPCRSLCAGLCIPWEYSMQIPQGFGALCPRECPQLAASWSHRCSHGALSACRRRQGP